MTGIKLTTCPRGFEPRWRLEPKATDFLDMYTQVRKDEQIISSPETGTQQDASMRRGKKMKQGEENALIG